MCVRTSSEKGGQQHYSVFCQFHQPESSMILSNNTWCACSMYVPRAKCLKYSGQSLKSANNNNLTHVLVPSREFQGKMRWDPTSPKAGTNNVTESITTLPTKNHGQAGRSYCDLEGRIFTYLSG